MCAVVVVLAIENKSGPLSNQEPPLFDVRGAKLSDCCSLALLVHVYVGGLLD